MINPSTPEHTAQTVGQHFSAPHQSYLAFPHATHNVTNGTPLQPGTSPAHCGQKLYLEFAADPTATLDTSCVAQALPLDFEGLAWAPYLLGEADFFENGASPAASPALAPPMVRRALRQLARRLRRDIPQLPRVAATARAVPATVLTSQ